MTLVMNPIAPSSSISISTPDSTTHQYHPARPIASSSSSYNMPPPSTIPSNRKRKAGPQPIAPAPTPSPLINSRHLLQQQSSPSASISSLSVDQDQDDDEYTPRTNLTGSSSRKSNTTTASTGVKRKQPPTAGNGNGKSTKMSREALRKANHSLIERRRREKINAALGELRRMVPGLGEDGGKAGEFKLEVLERTVSHMKDLKSHIIHLENIIAEHGINIPSMDNTSIPAGDDEEDDQDDRDGYRNSPSHHQHDSLMKDNSHHGSSRMVYSNSSTSYHHHHPEQGYRTQKGAHSNIYAPAPTPSHNQSSMFHTHAHSPYPSPRPDNELLDNEDPNETEPETNLPPPLTKALRHTISRHASPSVTTPSVASLIAQTGQNSPTPPPPVSRPAPPPQSNNPIFLPFPAPSPTSPFMNGNPSSSTTSSSAIHSSTASSSSFVSDPSPFLAPISGMSLFGGVLNLDLPSPADSLSHRVVRQSPPTLTLPPTNTREKLKDMPPEEAANLLLAFSSPDTLRPQTQAQIYSAHGAESREKRQRRLTLENDDFKLDDSNSPPHASDKLDNADTREKAGRSDRLSEQENGGLKGKSAMDILKMSMSDVDGQK